MDGLTGVFIEALCFDYVLSCNYSAFEAVISVYEVIQG